MDQVPSQILVECLLEVLGKIQSLAYLAPNHMSDLEMMSLRRDGHLVDYVKFILGMAGLFGILILIGQINASLQS